MKQLVASPETLWLPPPDAQLLNPKIDKIDTPVDDRGLIDIEQLITDVKRTIDPSYQWPIVTKSIHHIYWPMAQYPYDEDVIGNPGIFRNLPIHKALLPRVFENWLHTITLPPPKPEPEVREYRIESWNVTKDLFKMARHTVEHQKRARRRRIDVRSGHVEPKFDDDRIGEEWIQDQFEKNFRRWEYQVDRLYKLPPEFRMINLDDSPQQVAKNLGKIVMPKSLKLVKAVAY